jgi:N-acetyl-gamma-glutamyl-phosphate reductase
VAGTCRAQVSATVNEKAHMLVCAGAIDNLGKGAAGQAVQCANIVCDLPEDVGLNMIACPV